MKLLSLIKILWSRLNSIWQDKTIECDWWRERGQNYVQERKEEEEEGMINERKENFISKLERKCFYICPFVVCQPQNNSKDLSLV